ncbi:MAG TPA: hypothetical protein VFY65_09705, partial [Longimicrobium sp.]|nr:hypothetical protein [Longimicrobium sp.]
PGSGLCSASAILLLLALAAPAAAQRSAVTTELSVGAVAGRPAGDFRETMGDGYGAGLRSVQRLNAAPWLALRLEAGVLLQDLRRDSIPGAAAGGGRVDRATSNTLLFLGVGPQVGVTRGPVRPYAHLFGGVHYLVTDASYEARVEGQRFDYGGQSFEDATWAAGGGAGVYVPLGRGRRAPRLDLGATYRFGGEATFLTEEIVPIGPNVLAGELVSGRTDMLVVHLGLTFGGGR